jgi:hypothetical protein
MGSQKCKQDRNKKERQFHHPEPIAHIADMNVARCIVDLHQAAIHLALRRKRNGDHPNGNGQKD